MARDHGRRQLTAHRIQLLHPHAVFEPGERRLRGERLTRDRIAPEEQFVNRVVGQAVRVVRIRMAAGEPENALREQIPQRVLHFSRLPIIHEAAREAVDQPVARFRGFE